MHYLFSPINTHQYLLCIYIIYNQHMPIQIFRVGLLLLLLLAVVSPRWTEKQASDWYQRYSWSAGVNYIPAYADNQIDMWQNLNLDAIDQELRWAANIGFSKFRTFLHIGPFLKNSTQYIKDIFTFLAVAKSRGAQIIFVLFDDCWRDTWQNGKQPNPLPGIHNSQWLQCPGKVPVQESDLQNYVVQIVGAFRTSDAVVMWDLYNEVGNSGYLLKSLPLVTKAFEWARSANPTQPLTSGWWNGDASFNNINDFILNESDVITFHAYCDVSCTKAAIDRLRKYNRPIICTEYMARSTGSKFVTHLPVFKNESVWAINWGFVFGRTQTYYPWGSPAGAPVPKIWFHDVLHPDGTPFDPAETKLIREITA